MYPHGWNILYLLLLFVWLDLNVKIKLTGGWVVGGWVTTNFNVSSRQGFKL